MDQSDLTIRDEHARGNLMLPQEAFKALGRRGLPARQRAALIGSDAFRFDPHPDLPTAVVVPDAPVRLQQGVMLGKTKRQVLQQRFLIRRAPDELRGPPEHLAAESPDVGQPTGAIEEGFNGGVVGYGLQLRNELPLAHHARCEDQAGLPGQQQPFPLRRNIIMSVEGHGHPILGHR